MGNAAARTFQEVCFVEGIAYPVSDLCQGGGHDLRRRLCHAADFAAGGGGNKGWATDEELTDYFAIGQCTPGVIAVNTATFIGQKRRGILGGIVATLGVVFPSLVIIAALAGVITTFSHLAWVQHAFAGIRVCVCVLIFNAVLKLWKGAVKDVWGLVIFLVILALSVFTKLSPIIYVLAAAVAGLLIKNLGAKRS